MMAEIQYFINKAKQNMVSNFGRWSNFKVVVYFSSPICITTPWISLDSLIGHFMFMECLGRDFFITDKKINLSRYLPTGKMPYAVLYDDEHQLAVNNVSIGVPESDVKYRTEVLYKRFEDRFAEFGGRIRIGQGYFRSYAMKHIYVCTPKLTFYLRGCKDYIAGLLQRNLFALGNDHRVGYGFIKSFEVEDTDKNYSLVANGLAMRPIPVEICDDYEDVAQIAYRPPYWDRRNVRICVVPFTPCKLKAKWRPYYG